MKIYLIGSLRNPNIIPVTQKLIKAGHEVFSEWYGAGEHADDCFRDYHKALGRTYLEALKSDAAKTIFEFDKDHIDKAEAVVLVAPAGKSGHLELGYAIGKGKKGYYLLDDPERWDLMLQFCDGVFTDVESLIHRIEPKRWFDVGKIVPHHGYFSHVCSHSNWVFDPSKMVYSCETCGSWVSILATHSVTTGRR